MSIATVNLEKFTMNCVQFGRLRVNIKYLLQ